MSSSPPNIVKPSVVTSAPTTSEATPVSASWAALKRFFGFTATGAGVLSSALHQLWGDVSAPVDSLWFSGVGPDEGPGAIGTFMSFVGKIWVAVESRR